jgi:rhodanese-related sulfurtransferase
MMKFSRIMVTLLAAMGIYVGSANAQKEVAEQINAVSPQEFQSRLAADTTAYLLDARTATEYAAGHLKGAHQLNWLDSAAFENGAKLLDKSKTIYVYCRSGHRSGLAARYLAVRGYNIVDMKGGYLAWTAAGLETEK